MLYLRVPYTPQIFVAREGTLVCVGGAAVGAFGAGPPTTETLLYTGIPAVGAGAVAVIAFGASIPVALLVALAAGGVGYAVGQAKKQTAPGAADPDSEPIRDSTSTPGSTPVAASRESVKEMTNPSPRATESYATETADEKRARELAENWGYTHGVYDYCRMTGSPYDADPYVYVSHMGTGGKKLLLPPKTLFHSGGKTANDVFEENSRLRKIYIDNYPDAYDFGWKSARDDSGVCDASWAFFS